MDSQTTTVRADQVKVNDVIIAGGRICIVTRVLDMRHYVNLDLHDVNDDKFELEFRTFPHAVIDIETRK